MICVAAVGLGIDLEIMMVQWTVTMARNIPPDKLARVSSYDVLGSVMAMPARRASRWPHRGRDRGVRHPVRRRGADRRRARLLALVPREVRSLRAPEIPRSGQESEHAMAGS